MEPIRIVLGVIFAVVFIILSIYVSFTARNKGPILSNTYLWASKKERENIDKKKEYKLVTIVYGGLALFSLLESLYMFTDIMVFVYCGAFVLAVIIIYAILYSISNEKMI